MLKYRLRNLIQQVRRPLLRLLVKPRISGREHLQLDKHSYCILEHRRTTDTYLLRSLLEQSNQACSEQHLLYAQVHQGKLLREQLLEPARIALQAQALDIRLHPVACYYGRLPATPGLLKGLFTEGWQRTNPLSRLLQLILNGRQTQLVCSAPVHLHELIEEGISAEELAHKAARIIEQHFHRRREALTGPDLSHRHLLIEQILKHPDIRRTISTLASEGSASQAQLEQKARRHLNTIAADYQPTWVRLVSSLVSRFLKRYFSHIEVQGLDELETAASQYQLVYLPAHRSHMDYLLLAHVLHQRGLMLPHVAAGDNMNTRLLGPVLKRCGAIFMRRSFKDAPLYAALYRQYLIQMAHHGHALEYFIEGGRSRTGRLLPGKTGLLRATLAAAQDTDTRTALVPVWISYDQVAEGDQYPHLLEGARKRREGLRDILPMLLHLRRPHGQASLSFAPPLILDPARLPDAQVCAQQVQTAINRHCIANETALMAPLLLSRPQLALPQDQLIRLSMQLRSLAGKLPNAPAAMPQRPVKNWLNDAAQRDQLTLAHSDASLNLQQARAMSYAANTLQHLWVIPGLILLLSKRHPNPLSQTISRIIRQLYPFLRAELFLPWQDNEITQVIRQIRDHLKAAQLLEQRERTLRCTNNALSRALIHQAETLLLKHYLLLSVVNRFGSISHDNLVHDSRRLCQRLHRHYGFHAPDYGDTATLEILIKQLCQRGLLLQVEDERLSSTAEIAQVLKLADQVLPSELISFSQQQLSRLHRL